MTEVSSHVTAGRQQISVRAMSLVSLVVSTLCSVFPFASGRNGAADALRLRSELGERASDS